ncbi:diacylglycerol kinase [Bacteroidia bacterium]|nr:diacylglycerol kinase [Bacteroidia bacterium]
MKKQQKFSIRKRLKSFKYAFNGLRILFREEHNSRIHFVAALCVLIAGYFLNITATEWCIVIFAIGFVFAMEIINSAIENLADFVSTERHESIKRIKDLSAAGVLVSAIAALVVGIIVFLPKIID